MQGLPPCTGTAVSSQFTAPSNATNSIVHGTFEGDIMVGSTPVELEPSQELMTTNDVHIGVTNH